ncbi:MAG TPA: SCP2 sterol-binding domain-containing protein [Candidatus Thermoplasmatota archaeon]|nr:SCP2 sterol-binding domain-containing protein [Candidatus Thermoplasmatota archaeon]
MVEYFTHAYFQNIADLLNADPAFQEKASNLSTQLLFIAKDKGRAFLFKVEKGKVSAEPATPETPAEFAFTSDYATWVTNHRDGKTLEMLIMSGKVRMKGSIPRILQLKSQLGAVDQKARSIPAVY